MAIICSILALCSTIILLFLLLKKEEKKSLEEAYLELQELYQLEAARAFASSLKKHTQG